MSAPIVIVGAGVGGLAAAMQLAGAGHEVLVLEKEAAVGGKMRLVSPGAEGPDGEPGAAGIDAGPTVFTMGWVFERLFAAAGSCFADAVVTQPLDVLARHAWDRPDPFDLPADPRAAADAVGAFFGAREAQGFARMMRDAGAMHDALMDPFMDAQKPGPLELAARFGLSGLGRLLATRPFDTLWRALSDYFEDPRLRQLYGRYATYCGGSPFRAPATLMLVAHVEQAGVRAVRGGMHALAQAMAQAAEGAGARIETGARVREIETASGRACGVRLADGRRIEARGIIVNADPAAVASGLFGAEAMRASDAVPVARRSLSAVTWAMRARTGGLPLLRHNVFFSTDSRREFDALDAGRVPEDATIYLCAQDRQGGAEPADGTGERLLMLINAPARGDTQPLDDKDLDACLTRSLARLDRCGLSLDCPPRMRVTTGPSGFDRLFPGSGGAIYGPAPHGAMAPFRRPGARTRMPGLYLAGGATHPSAGVPMAALSGCRAAEALHGDLASMRRSRPAATSGGMSTPSAMTAGTR